MWFELLPSHTTYTLVSYMCLLELILSLWFWDFPSGIWAAPCKTTYIIIRVPVLMFFITRSVFELSLGFVLGVYPFLTGVIWASASTYYIYLGVLDMFIWAQSELDFEPMQNKTKNHTRVCVDVPHRYMDIWPHFQLCLELLPKWFELLCLRRLLCWI